LSLALELKEEESKQKMKCKKVCSSTEMDIRDIVVRSSCMYGPSHSHLGETTFTLIFEVMSNDSQDKQYPDLQESYLLYVYMYIVVMYVFL